MKSTELNSGRGPSPYFSTCETKRQTPSCDSFKLLPYPTSIHDYIDDVVEISREYSQASYF